MELTALKPERVADIIETRGGLIIDLRPIDEYLRKHIRGSIPLLFDNATGFSGRARDLIPLDSPCVLVDSGSANLDEAAEIMRARGFDVPGYLQNLDGLPGSKPGPTEVVTLMRPGELVLLDVGDPGTEAPRNTTKIPLERLWTEAPKLDKASTIGVLAGWGVRAAAAIGILEKLGFARPLFVRTRPVGAVPPTAGPESTIFRTGRTQV